MTHEKFMDSLKREGHLWDIGQLTKGTVNKLNELIKQGLVEKQKLLWPWFHTGTARKTVYFWKGDLHQSLNKKEN